MNFSEALEMLRRGVSIRRPGWSLAGVTLDEKEGRLVLLGNHWLPSHMDLLANDWVAVGERYRP